MRILLLLLLPTLATAADIYLSPAGNDAWSGTLDGPNHSGTDGPLATPAAAQAAARELRRQGQPVRLVVRGGVWRLAEPLRFTPDDSGTAAAPVVWEAAPGERPVFSGGRVIDGWRPDGDGVWSAAVPDVASGDWDFHELFIDGRRAQRCRLPNTGYLRTAGALQPVIRDRDHPEYGDRERRIGLRYREGDLAAWPDLEQATLYLYHAWTASVHWIESVDEANRTVRFTAPSGWPVGYWEEEQRYVIENVRAAFDAPGEWYLNRAEGRVYYRPLPGEDPAALEFVAPYLEHVVELRGEPAVGAWVEHVTLRGLGLEHSAWRLPRDQSHDGQACVNSLRQALPGALDAQGARACLFEELTITHAGQNGVRLGAGCRDNLVRRCEIADLGAGGVYIGEANTESDERIDCRNNTVENCFIHDGGHIAPAGIGVVILRSSHNTVRRNEICDFYYSGISVGWDWGFSPTSAHHNTIEGNHLHHLGCGVLSDLGGIYTLGISPGTVLRENVIHDVYAYSYGGWGLYNDASSSEILLERNLTYDTKSEGYHRGNGVNNVLRHNVFAATDEGMVLRSVNMGILQDEPSFTFERNVVASDSGWMLNGRWGDGQFVFRDNLYWSYGAEPFFDGLPLADWQAAGHDAGSRLADPRFVDPAERDYRLRPDSPARAMGIEPLGDLSRVGLYGDEAWTRRPRQVTHREVDPAMKPPRSYQPPRITIVEDFEGTAAGDPPAGDGGDLKLLTVTDATAGQGRHALRFVDSPDHPQVWQPHYYYNVAWHGDRRATGRFRLRLEPGARLTHEWRDWTNSPFLPGPHVDFTGEGEVRVGGEVVARCPVGEWFEVALSAGLGELADGTFELTIAAPGAEPQVVRGLPIAGEGWQRCTWIGWVSGGTEAAVFDIDDLEFGLVGR